MKDPKSIKTRRSYDAEFKQEMTRMLASRRSAKEISEAFGIAENLLYRWNELIKKVGIQQANSFLTLALDIPFKRPEKRTLPKATADAIRILEQLAGVLSLAALKTKGHQMLSAQ